VSPREKVRIVCDCKYLECEQHFSIEHGILRQTYICRRPENAGCVCEFYLSGGARCEFMVPVEGEAGEEDEESETVHIEVQEKTEEE